MGMHSATTILDDIIDELRLKYDSSVGLLDGAAIREVPNLNTLQNLSKLLTKLSNTLDETEKKDQALLAAVSRKLAPDEVDEKEAEDVAQDTAAAEDDPFPTGVKREHDDDDDDDDDVPQPLKRRQEPGEEPAKAEPDGSVNSKDDPVPPVQIGSYTQEHDTRLKNPRSEFVGSQTLSAAAIAELGLYSEENNGLEAHGTEYLRKRYGVASYPENDLKSMLAGTIPDTDFSKTKAPTNQVQFSTYQSYIESYFRPFASDDIAFANDKYVLPPGFEKNYDPEVSPYVIPKLGAYYADAWAEEDANLGSKLSSPSYQRPPLEAFRPKGDPEELADDKLVTEDVSCGPLSSRLLSAIMSIHEVKPGENRGDHGDDHDDHDDDDDDDEKLIDNVFGDDAACQLDAGDAYKNTSETNDFHSMEERLKRELKYIGIFMNVPGEKKKGNVLDSDEWLLNKEDDEICSEMRVLQEELKGAVARNRKRKKALVPIIDEQLAYQEYCTILEDLDKQVDQAYTKRLKAKSKKKKTGGETTSLAQQQAANSGLRSLLEKRTRWISNIGKLFAPPEIMKRIPQESVFQNDEASDDEEEADVDVVNDD